jgi:hypothetical protein
VFAVVVVVVVVVGWFEVLVLDNKSAGAKSFF